VAKAILLFQLQKVVRAVAPAPVSRVGRGRATGAEEGRRRVPLGAAVGLGVARLVSGLWHGVRQGDVTLVRWGERVAEPVTAI